VVLPIIPYFALGANGMVYFLGMINQAHGNINRKQRVQNTLVVVFTLLLGMTAGSYLYLFVFTPNYADNPLVTGTMSAPPAIAIFAEQYGGGMEAGNLPNFEVTDAGTYIYTPFSDTATTIPTLITGELPALLRQELGAELTPRALTAAAEEITPESCIIFVDGIEFRYRIARADTTYVLDTCGTNFDRTSSLGQTLGKIWDYMERPMPTESDL